MGVPEILAGMMFGALLLYAVLAGADFGGGIWDLLASGPRAAAQRSLIERAIAPVWEANHVWLVVIVVILFTAYPAAFSAASVALHVPITLVLIGIVFRGSAFVFRKYDPASEPSADRRWGRIFAVSSVISPFFLGVSLAAVTTGRLDPDPAGGDFTSRFVTPWLDAFSLLVGALALALFAFLSAVYLTLEAKDAALRDDFRRRATIAGLGCLGLLGATTAASFVPTMTPFRERFAAGAWFVLPVAATSWAAAFWALRARRFAVARAAAVLVVTVTLGGWAKGQYPFLVAPGLTIRNAAAPDATLRVLMIALLAGGVVLFPSLFWLLRVFKRQST